MLINTIKWDALDHWRYAVRWVLLWALVIWLLGSILLLLTPSFNFEIGDTYIALRPEFLLSALIFFGGFFMYIYPIISTIYDLVSSRRISERLINRPYTMVFAVKLLFNMLAFMIGFIINSLAPTEDLFGLFSGLHGTQFSIFSAALFVPTTIAFYIIAYQTILAKGISKVFSVEGILSLVLALLLAFNGMLNLPVSDFTEFALFVAAFIMIVYLYERKFEI